MSAAPWPARALVEGLYFQALQRAPSLTGPLCAAVARTVAALPPSRGVLRRNARLALGEQASAASVQDTAMAMSRSMQLGIAETLQSQACSAEELAARVVRFAGVEAYHQARSHTRGMVIAGIHMGAFEPCLALLRRYEKRVHVLFQPDPVPTFERARSRMRRAIGVVEHSASDGLAAWCGLRDALHANEVVVLHADRVMPGQQGHRMPFLGCAQALLPTGPVRLALSCGSAMVPTHCVRARDGLEVHMGEPIVGEPANLRGHEVADHAAQRALVAAMERAIRLHPQQWMAFWPVEAAA